MRSITANWFICKIRHEVVTEDGLTKNATEQYVVNAMSFTEAEARITEDLSHYMSSGFEVVEIDRCAFKEVFFSDLDSADKWYKAKVQFITIDEKTDKEKKQSVYYLVQGSSLEDARKNIDEVFSDTMIDYSIAGVNETKIMDVCEYKAE